MGLKDQAKSAAMDRLGDKAMQFILDLPRTGEVGGAKQENPVPLKTTSSFDLTSLR